MSKLNLSRSLRRWFGSNTGIAYSTMRKASAKGSAMKAGQRFALLEELENRRVLSVTVQFDYTLDTNGFFLQQSRRDLLQAAADTLTANLQDTLTAITPGGANSYNFDTFNPGTLLDVSIPNVAVPANTIIIYAAGSSLGDGILGLGGPASYSGLTGSQTFIDSVAGRGQAGAIATPATDFGSPGGSIAFNVDMPWYFGSAISGIGSGQDDFYSVALHELGHVLGIGTADSWQNLITGTTFNGLQSRAANNGIAPSVTADGGHWADNTVSNGQEASMTPSIASGVRKNFTPLDFSGLDDLGWDLQAGIDFIAPNVTINQGPSQTDPATSSPVSFTVSFSEPITGFSGADIDLSSSTTPGTLVASVISQGDGLNFTVLVSGMTGSGNIIARVAAGAAVDAAGNTSIASTSTDNVVFYDALAFTGTIEQAAGQVDPSNGAIVFTVSFNHVTTDFTTGDVSFAGSTTPGTLIGNVTSLGDGMHYTVTVTGMIGSGVVVANIPAGVAVDTLGRANMASTSLDNSITYDVTPPVVTVNQAAYQLDPTRSSIIYYTVSFSEPVTGFTNTDVILDGTTAANLGDLTAIITGSGADYTVAISGMNHTGVVVINIPAGAVLDAAGNTNPASTSSDNVVLFDVTRPTVTLNQKAGQPDPTNNAAGIEFIATFSEPVVNFYPAGLSFSGSTVGGTLSGQITALDAEGTTFLINVTGMTSDGVVILSLPAGAATDPALNPSFASISIDNTVTFDITRPTVTLASTAPGYTAASSIPVTVTFSKPVFGFTAGDLSVGNAVVSNFAGSGTSYSFTLSPVAQGTFTVAVNANGANDLASNGNVGSQTLARVYDIARPTVTIEQADDQEDPTYTGPVQFTVTFNEPIADFTSSDIILSGSAVPASPVIAISGLGPVYTVTVYGVVQLGSLSATVATSSVADRAGNLNIDATSIDNTVTVINSLPEISGFARAPEQLNIGQTASLGVDEVIVGRYPIVAVNFYRDANGDGILQPDGDTLVGTDNSASGGWKIAGSTSSLPPGYATYFARADDDHGNYSNVITSFATTYRALPSVNGKASYKDAAGRTVKVVLTGGGTFDVGFFTSSGGGNPGAILVKDSTAKSVLTITTSSGRTTEIGQIIVGNTSDDNDYTSIRSITAPKVNLSGLLITGGASSISAGNLSNAIVDIGAAPSAVATMSLKFDQISDTQFTSGTAIGSFTATVWRDTDETPDSLTAPWINSLNVTGASGVRGDFSADLNLTSGIVANSLGILTVEGDLRGSTIRTFNGVGTVKLGAMIDSSIYSGFRNDVEGVPTGADFVSRTHSFIRSLTIIKTTSGAFANSNLAAAKLGKIKLTTVNVNNDGAAFGLASVTTESYTGPGAAGDFKNVHLVPLLGGAAA